MIIFRKHKRIQYISTNYIFIAMKKYPTAATSVRGGQFILAHSNMETLAYRGRENTMTFLRNIKC